MIIIGNPENRRVLQFQKALHGMTGRQARVISYLDILEGHIVLADELKKASCIRVESPGENFQVERRILEWGGLEAASDLEEDIGRIYFPGVLFKGFKKLMEAVSEAADENVVWFNHPSDILAMFDKPLTKKINAPHCLPTLPTFSDYEEFLTYVKSQKKSRFFIKLNYGSCASGIVAFEYNRTTGQVHGQTTVEIVRQGSACHFYNSLRVKKYKDPNDLADIINFLFAEGAYVEEWVPKHTLDEGVFDLRVLAVKGQRKHTIARVGKTPFTNLHLGNRRCEIDRLHMSADQWRKIDELVWEVMQNFPKSLYSGLDILVPDGQDKSPILLEANAFGDLLPESLHEGQSTYQAELAALYQQHPHLKKEWLSC